MKNWTKNKKGQATLEAIFIMNIMFFLFFAFLMLASYNYNKMVVLYAANSAVSKGVSQAANAGMTLRRLERIMKSEADRALENGLVLRNTGSTAKADVKSAGIATFSVTASGRHGLSIPFVSDLLNNQLITYTVEYNYYDPNF